MLTHYKQSAEAFLEPIIQPLSKVNPNTLTLVGSIPSLLFFVFVIQHWYLLALLAFVGNAFDLIDGMVARKYNKVTAYGGFLDSTMDRVADFLLITAFAFGGIVRWEIVAPLLLFSFLISYTRGMSEKLAYAKGDHATKFAVGLIERTERLAVTFFALILYILFPSFSFVELNIAEIVFAVLMVLSAYTSLQRILFAQKKL